MMNSDKHLLWVLIAYALLFIIGVVSVTLWRVRRAKLKPPLEFKLLRAPGESLRRRITKFDEESFPLFFLVSMAPPLAALGIIQILYRIATKLGPYPILGIGTFVMVTGIFLAGRFCVRRLMRYRNDSLGYLGERAVGESLAALEREGFRVFHDVPAAARGADFNIDHVVIGRNGVFAIETKTRRKGRARPGYEAHKVTYDGKQLIWPWTEDTFGLDQASSRAEWLNGWLRKMTGVEVQARPVLALPGWFIVPQGLGPVLVLNHKQLAGALSRTTAASLTADQVDLLARQLDAVCRDVED